MLSCRHQIPPAETARMAADFDGVDGDSSVLPCRRLVCAHRRYSHPRQQHCARVCELKTHVLLTMQTLFSNTTTPCVALRMSLHVPSKLRV